MIDIQSPTAEIRRGKKKKKERIRKKPQDEDIISASAIRRSAIISKQMHNRLDVLRCKSHVGL